MREYKFISKQIYSLNEYQIVPIRDEDRYKIMQWRNDQIYHLRQSKPLDKDEQDRYFNFVIAKLFEKENPDQILFSYLQNGNCIGYGGLVHINWIDKNAEISFLIDSSHEHFFFKLHWGIFLRLIEIVAFSSMNFKKIFTYAYNIRPKLFEVLNEYNYIKEAELSDHILINGTLEIILINSKFNKKK
jgi:hypothetical protein